MTVTDEIRKLKEERNAVILAHYYTIREIQELADYTGDSFYLSKLATELPNKTIVFCGVTFMGESAKLLIEKARTWYQYSRALDEISERLSSVTQK